MKSSEAGEKQVLGAILSDPGAAEAVRGKLAACDFCFQKHQLIFDACQELDQAGSSVDQLTVSDLLTQRGDIQKAGGHGYLSELTDGHITSSNLGSAIDLVKEAALKRYLVKAAEQAAAAAKNGKGAREVISVLQNDLSLIVESSSPVYTRPGFHFRAASDLCAVPTSTPWLVKDYLSTGCLGMWFGPAGSMKSFCAIDLGLSIATGEDWQCQEVRLAGPVFYICGEGFLGINRRVKAWSIHHGIDLGGVPFFVSDRPARFLDDDGAAEIMGAVDALVEIHGEPVLVVIDTLNRNFGPGDENSTQDMTRFISTIDAALRSRYGCAVIIIHHSGLTATERARGASALRAALDWEYRLEKNSDGTRVLACTKAKDHGEPPALSFKPETVTLDGWSDPENGETMTSCVLVRTAGAAPSTRPISGARKIALDALLSSGKSRVHIDEWRGAAYSAGITPSSSPEAKKKAFQRAVADLRNTGYVETKNDFWWPIRDTGQ